MGEPQAEDLEKDLAGWEEKRRDGGVAQSRIRLRCARLTKILDSGLGSTELH